MKEIAHRGYSDLHKDNTKCAFMSSVLYQFDMIELDIQLTKDDTIIIYHDTFLKDQLIINKNYHEILQDNKDIITLEEFFEFIDVSKIQIYLDIKGNELKIASILNDLIKNNPYHYNIFLASFNLSIIQELYKLNPRLQFGFITENMFPKDIFSQMIKEYHLRFISFHWTMLDLSIIEFLHCNHVMVFTYTAKNKEILSFMEHYEIDGIITNGKLLDYRKGIYKKKKDIQKESILTTILTTLTSLTTLSTFQIKNFFKKE